MKAETEMEADGKTKGEDGHVGVEGGGGIHDTQK